MKNFNFSKEEVNIWGFKYSTKNFVLVSILFICAILVLVGLGMFGIDISWYGVMIGIAFLVAITITSQLSSNRGIDKDFAYDLIFWIFPFAIIGARLHYCFCNMEMFEDNLIEILYVWNGGVAVHGGIAGGLVGLILCCLFKKISILSTTDVVVPALAMGQFIGRIGCVFGECCYGVECTKEALQWIPISIKVGNQWHYASNLYEGIFDLINFIVLTIILRNCKTKGITTFTYLLVYGVVRFFIEMTRDNSQIMRVFDVSIAQVISVIIAIIGIVGIIICKVVNTHKNKVSE